MFNLPSFAELLIIASLVLGLLKPRELRSIVSYFSRLKEHLTLIVAQFFGFKVKTSHFARMNSERLDFPRNKRRVARSSRKGGVFPKYGAPDDADFFAVYSNKIQKKYYNKWL